MSSLKPKPTYDTAKVAIEQAVRAQRDGSQSSAGVVRVCLDELIGVVTHDQYNSQMLVGYITATLAHLPVEVTIIPETAAEQQRNAQLRRDLPNYMGVQQ